LFIFVDQIYTERRSTYFSFLSINLNITNSFNLSDCPKKILG